MPSATPGKARNRSSTSCPRLRGASVAIRTRSNDSIQRRSPLASWIWPLAAMPGHFGGLSGRALVERRCVRQGKKTRRGRRGADAPCLGLGISASVRRFAPPPSHWTSGAGGLRPPAPRVGQAGQALRSRAPPGELVSPPVTLSSRGRFSAARHRSESGAPARASTSAP